MKIKFVGTGSGKTSLNQFHSSLIIFSDNYNLLIDAGDGISRALLFNKIEFNQIDGIIITHLHPDHFSGLPSLILQMKMTNRKKLLDIFIHKSLKKIVEYFILQSYVIPEKMNFKMHFKSFNDNEQINISKNFTFQARQNSHLAKLQKYKIDYPSISLYSGSMILEVEGKKIIYTSDIGSVEDLLLFKEFSSDILICEATHLEAPILIEEIKKIETGKIYLTHYSDENLKIISEILATQTSAIKQKIVIAKDGLSLQI